MLSAPSSSDARIGGVPSSAAVFDDSGRARKTGVGVSCTACTRDSGFVFLGIVDVDPLVATSDAAPTALVFRALPAFGGGGGRATAW